MPPEPKLEGDLHTHVETAISARNPSSSASASASTSSWMSYNGLVRLFCSTAPHTPDLPLERLSREKDELIRPADAGYDSAAWGDYTTIYKSCMAQTDESHSI